MIRQVARKRFLESNLKQMIYEQQRFRRYLKQPKELWKPVSVQRLFNVPQKKQLSEEDTAMLEVEEAAYLDQYRSIKEFFHQEFTIPVLQGGSNIELKEVQEEHRLLIEENNQENERMAKFREERLKEERKKEELEDLKLSLIENEKYQVKKEQAIQRILEEKDRYPNYITKERLKGAIETALDHPTTYEFAIDLNGTLAFDKKLHPYALDPSATPESSDVIEGYANEQTVVQLQAKKLYYDT